VLDEFKRIAARRAVQYVMSTLDRGAVNKSAESDENSEDE